MDDGASVRSWWPWAVGLVVLALLIWALSGMLRGGDSGVEVKEAVPATG